MFVSRYVLVLLVLLVAFTITGHSQAETTVQKSEITESIDGKEYYLHFVKNGETLFAIARAYGVTVDDIFRANPDSRKGINEGSVLKVPVKKTAVKTPESQVTGQDGAYFYHIVKKQETLYGISKKYGVSIEAVRDLNPQLNEYPREGETLKIPAINKANSPRSGEWEGSTVTHTVIQGETLYGIARQYDVTIGEIKNANPGLTENLRIGESIKIPNQGLAADQPEEDEEDEGAKLMHEVVPGETLYGIARNYSMSIDTLRKYNPGLSTAISPGQQIFIPETVNSKGFIVHKPVKNEKLDGISEMYEVPLADLEKMNPNLGKKVKKGQVVRIPVEAREPAEAESAIDTEAEEPATGSEGCTDDVTLNTNTYNIALMLPLFLEEMDSIDFKEERDFEKLSNLVSFRFAGFYSGFRMAVDSMKNMGMRVNLFVYDVDNDPVKAVRALQASELSSMDLIIGPFYLNNFRKVADFAETYQIPIVNPLSQREEIIFNNPSVFKVRPSESKQIDLLVNYLEYKYPFHNIVLLRNNKYKYQTEVSYIRNTLNTSRPSSIKISNRHISQVMAGQEGRKNMFTENKLLEPAMIREKLDDSTFFSNLVKEVVYVDDSITGLSMNLSRVRPNVVIALSDDIVFTKEALSQLNKMALDHEITLFGLPSWNEFRDLETNHLLNLHLHTFSPTLVNYGSTRVTSWIKDFRELYNTDPTPGNYAFDGFDVGWYFLNALHTYGRDFQYCLPFLHVQLIQTSFSFEQTPGNGFMNTYWNLGKYEDYEYRKIQFRVE